MKLVFYHLASYADELRIAAEEIIVDIMDVQVDVGWLLLTKTTGFQALFSRLSILLTASSRLPSPPI